MLELAALDAVVVVSVVLVAELVTYDTVGWDWAEDAGDVDAVVASWGGGIDVGTGGGGTRNLQLSSEE